MAGDLIPITGRWRPPDPGNETAAKVRQDQSGGWENKSTLGTATNYSDGADCSSRSSRIVAKPYAGHFAATFLQKRDGTEVRLQIFPDAYAAAWSAKLLNSAIRECLT